MLEFMHELLKPLLDSFSSLKMQLQAALSIPVTDTAKLDEPEGVARDSMDEQGAPDSSGKSFRCVTDRPGYLTSNGRGSLEIGAAHDD
jgi:hypothetical protein